MGFELSPKAAKRVLGVAGVVFGIALAMLIRGSWTAPPTHTLAATARVAAAVDQHLKWAEQHSAEGLPPQFEPIHAFFEEARAGVRPFAEDALGWTSKWKLIGEYFGGGDGHKAYLEERFAEHLFTAAELEGLVQQVVAGYLSHLDQVDNLLLVRIEADLEGIPIGRFTAGIDHVAIEQALSTAIREALAAAEADVPSMIGREFTSFVAGEVLTVAGVQLATSAGIIGVGAASGTVTFGIGLIAGIIVDAIINAVMDPAGELSDQLNDTLLRLEALIVSGDGEQPGLYQRLRDFASLRAEARRTAITAVGLPLGQPSVAPSF